MSYEVRIWIYGLSDSVYDSDNELVDTNMNNYYIDERGYVIVVAGQLSLEAYRLIKQMNLSIKYLYKESTEC